MMSQLTINRKRKINYLLSIGLLWYFRKFCSLWLTDDDIIATVQNEEEDENNGDKE